MGTWGAGPFGSDEALDFVNEVSDRLTEEVESFVRSPQIDEGFDSAFAAVGLLNLLEVGAKGLGAGRSPISLPDPEDARRWRVAMLKCFDENIEKLVPQPGFVEEQRAKLVEHLDRLVENAEAADRE
jgi:hypothetical protein